jgi:hypothetical protein
LASARAKKKKEKQNTPENPEQMIKMINLYTGVGALAFGGGGAERLGAFVDAPIDGLFV